MTMAKRMKAVKIFNDSLTHLPVRYCRQRIYSIAIICFCTLAFVFVGSLPVFLASFILLDHCIPLLVHCLPLLLPRGDCCCGFLSRYVPRIRTFRCFYLAPDPFVTRIVSIFFYLKFRWLLPKWLNRCAGRYTRSRNSG